MSIFDDIIQIDETGEIVYNQWVEWDHFSVPNKPQWLRTLLRNIIALFGHRMDCSALDGCYLVKRNMPSQPLHDNCDCKIQDITYAKVKEKLTAECDIRKFTEYVFKNVKESHGKNKIFSDLNFSIEDADYLQKEYCRQAEYQYSLGNYVLKFLNKRGQRMAIPTTLKGTTFYSGWMLCPEGKIKNTTPFGGWIK